MILQLLIATVMTIALVVDFIKDTEFTAVATFVVVVLATICGFQEYYFVVIAMILKPMVYTIVHRDVVRSLGLKLTILPYIPILMYLSSGIAFGYMAQRIIIPLLDLWASRVLFILLIFLALYLTIAPSLSTLSTPVILLSVSIDTLNKTLYWLSMLAGAVITIYMVIEARTYTMIPLIPVLVLVYYRRRLGILKRYLISITFFVSLLVLSLAIA